MDWEACCNKKVVKSITPDLDMATALVKSSNNKLQSEAQLPLNEVTSSSKISLAYDSLRELLEAVALRKGFKVYNHECYTAFLKEVLQESDQGDAFDRIRKIRNDINYYGKEISIAEAQRILKEIKVLRQFVSKL